MAEIFSATLEKFSANLPPHWLTYDWVQGSLSWRSFSLPGRSFAAQGWKLHVSAGAVEVADMYSLVIPLLLQFEATFKVARSLNDVVFINSGDGGAPQLGKVMTIYPESDDHARDIVLQIDRVWPRSRGPEVQTDLHIRPGSAVSLRYGTFGSQPIMVNESGIYEYALCGSNGTLVADMRQLNGEQSRLAPVPPVDCCRPRQPPIELNVPFVVNGKEFVALTSLSVRPGKQIFLGLAIDTLRSVIIKIGIPGVAGDHRGLDVRDNLKKEFFVLSALSDKEGLAPKPLEWFEHEWPVGITEDFRGSTIAELGREQQISCLVLLANAVVRLHGAGFVHGDIKLENAILRDRRVGLIDFELSEREGDIAGVGGTRGYLAPEVTADAIATFPRDIYALGMCVAHACLGIPPGLLPAGIGRVQGFLEIEGLYPARQLIHDFCHTDPAARPNATEAEAAISAGIKLRSWEPVADGRPSTVEDLNWCRRASIGAASFVERYWCAEQRGGGWRNEHFMSSFTCEGINIGAAGIVIGLATIDAALNRSDFSGHMDEGARWLSNRPPLKKAVGVFTGNAGVAIALALTGRRLNSQAYLVAAQERFASACTSPRETDLFSGSAGVLWAGCILNEILKETWPLELAHRAVCHINASSSDVAGIPVWTLEPGTDTPYLGCAHGSAGVAMALGCWGRRVGDQDCVETAVGTFQQIAKRGRTDNGLALKMAVNSNRHHAVGNWCHGVAGYLWAILQGLGDTPSLRAEIDWAVDILQDERSVGTPTYCHGLSGQLELWRMLRGIPRFQRLAEARAGKVAHALRCAHSKRGGNCLWVSDDPDVITPDLWVGFLGPATALALHASGSPWPLLSAEWLTTCSNPDSGADVPVRG